MSDKISLQAREALLRPDRLIRYEVAKDYAFGAVAATVERMLDDARILSSSDVLAHPDEMMAIHQVAAQATEESGIAQQRIELEDFQGRFHLGYIHEYLDQAYYDYSRQQIADRFGRRFKGFVKQLVVGMYTDFETDDSNARYGLGYAVPSNLHINEEFAMGYWFVPVLGTHATVALPPECS